MEYNETKPGNQQYISMVHKGGRPVWSGFTFVVNLLVFPSAMSLEKLHSLQSATEDLFSQDSTAHMDRLRNVEAITRDVYFDTWRCQNLSDRSAALHQMEVTSQALKAVVPTCALSEDERAIADDFVSNVSEREIEIRDAIHEELCEPLVVGA